MLDTGRVASESSDGDFVRFWGTGDRVAGEFHCADCGYGVAIQRRLPVCPMCGGEVWEQSDWSPFSRAAARDGAA